ncbi:MAG: DUF4097 family beta strand repeat protein [Clostridia bacterium]|nr:DUF4097 family beta strand repeat protein [Clostridia bacterium]
MKKTGAIIGLVLSVISLIVLCSLFTALMALDSIKDISFGIMSVKYNNAEDYSVGSAEIGSNIKSLDIEWISDSVTVEIYTGDTVQISESSESILDEEDQLRYRVKNGKLTIKPCKPMWFIGINNIPKKTLKVLVPVNMADGFDSIVISTTSADIDISAFTAKEFDLETVSGNITAQRLKGDDISTETVSGNVKINAEAVDLSYENVNGKLEFTGTLDRFDCETVNGSIRMTFENTPSEIDCELVNGDIVIYLPDDAEFGGKYEMVNGDFICEFTGKVSKGSFDCGRSYGYDFEAVNGDVEIRRNNSSY